MNLDRFSVALENEYPYMMDDISNSEWCECGEFMKEPGEDACEDCLEAQEQEEVESEGLSQEQVDEVIARYKRVANE